MCIRKSCERRIVSGKRRRHGRCCWQQSCFHNRSVISEQLRGSGSTDEAQTAIALLRIAVSLQLIQKPSARAPLKTALDHESIIVIVGFRCFRHSLLEHTPQFGDFTISYNSACPVMLRVRLPRRMRGASQRHLFVDDFSA